MTDFCRRLPRESSGRKPRYHLQTGSRTKAAGRTNNVSNRESGRDKDHLLFKINKED